MRAFGRGLASCGGDFLLCHTVIRLAGRAALNGAGRILCAVLAEKPSGITGASGIAAEKSIRGQAGSVWTKPYIRPTVLLSVVWFCVVFSYYGMFLWLPSVMLMKGYSMIESFEYVLLMTLAQLPGYFSAAWLIEKAGRKTILVIYLLGTAGSAYFFGATDSLAMLLAAGMLLSFFNLGAWGVLYAYTPEQYPAAIRATGSGTTAAVGRIGGIFYPLLVGSLAARNVSFTAIFAVFCAAILVAVITIIILGKETKQTELAQ